MVKIDINGNMIMLWVIVYLWMMPYCFAATTTPTITVDLQDISVQDALHLMARFMKINIVIDPAIKGTTSLHVHHMPADQALDMVLAAQKLNKWHANNVWYIMTKEAWLQRQQDDLQLQIAMQASAPLLTRVWQIHYANAGDIAHVIQDTSASLLSKRGHIRVDARTNIVCVHDIDESIQTINRLIQRLDIPVQQVLIEAYLASVDSDYEHALGIRFMTEQADGDHHISLAVLKLPDSSLLDMQLTALENSGHGELISKPSLFTANQQTASIESGEEIPYQEVSASGATSVTFKKAVLSLEVTPQVMPDDRVLLALHVNQDKPSNRMVLGVPAISTRQMSTHILVKNGQTIVLGGIYETNDQHNLQQIPFLGKIPYIGWLFRQQDSVKIKRELLIFVTPRIIR